MRKWFVVFTAFCLAVFVMSISFSEGQYGPIDFEIEENVLEGKDPYFSLIDPKDYVDNYTVLHSGIVDDIVGGLMGFGPVDTSMHAIPFFGPAVEPGQYTFSVVGIKEGTNDLDDLRKQSASKVINVIPNPNRPLPHAIVANRTDTVANSTILFTADTKDVDRVTLRRTIIQPNTESEPIAEPNEVYTAYGDKTEIRLDIYGSFPIGTIFRCEFAFQERGVWSKYCEPIDIRLVDALSLSKPVIHAPEVIEAGEDLTFSIDEVPSAWTYEVEISDEYGLLMHSWNANTERVYTIQGEGVKPGYYTFRVTAISEDELAKSSNEVTVAVIEGFNRIRSFVSRCYNLILNRIADEEGLNTWATLLAKKDAASANIIDGFVRSDEFTNRKLSDSDKVDTLYKTMLNREADAGGKAGWVDALSKGYTLQNIINGFCGSAEFKALCQDYGIEPGTVEASVPADTSTPRGKIEAFVKRCYQLILNRAADDGGLKGWSDALEGKTAAAAQIIDGFVRSPEYINRSLTSDQSVTILYKTMLDRDPDEAGKAGWVDALSKGYTLQHIINGFCGSAEFTKICSDYGIEAGSVAVPTQSAAALEAQKLPDERIGNAVSADDAGITVVNGYEPAEVEAFVKHAYRAALGREADEAGLSGWTEQIVSGAVTPKAFLRTLLFSDEQIARKLNNEQYIDMLYHLYLNRGIDDAAAERVEQLAAGGLDEVIKGFEGSAEFRLVLNGFGL